MVIWSENIQLILLQYSAFKHKHTSKGGKKHHTFFILNLL